MKKHVVECIVYLLSDIESEVRSSVPSDSDDLMIRNLLMSTYRARVDLALMYLNNYLGELNEKSSSDEA